MKKILLGLFAIVMCLTVITGCDTLEEEQNFSHEITNEYTDSVGTHYIEGTVTNSNDKEFSYVQIEFVCYDKDGNNLGTALDNTNNLGASETWKFKAMGLFNDSTVDHCDYKEITSW